MKMSKNEAMSAIELDFNLDYLTMRLEQIDNKIVRANEDQINEQLLICQSKLARAEDHLQVINHLMKTAARGTDGLFAHQLELAFFKEYKEEQVKDQSWELQPSRKLG
ncbi:hypothetical protein ACFP7A_09850 [Sporolactobacillus kofuensis]|uniref:Uncharacterized protein n=1 Tax=Sporolactobacillus kofuensis TaxID=269672 RepID=A0ABW1WIF5_9BACL|nr:hypothetical protein [Sporolactobacillus kofuensis]MCO7176179.1 hypothetical protein [Sporolactobacillus kofuensis]